jgi:hypothetical protein
MATYLFSGSRNPAAILLSSSHLFLVSIISLSSPFEAVFRYHSTPPFVGPRTLQRQRAPLVEISPSSTGAGKRDGQWALGT